MSVDESKATFRVVKRYSDGSGFTTIYGDTQSFEEALIARAAANIASGYDCFIVAVAPDDDDYNTVLSSLDMVSI